MNEERRPPSHPSSAFAAAAAAFCLVVAPTAQGFLRNRLEFDLTNHDFASYLLGAGAVSFALLAVALRRSRVRPALLIVLLGVCLAALVEGQFLGASYGPLAGGGLKPRNAFGSTWGNLGVWLAAGALVVLGRRVLLQNARRLLMALAGLQAAYLAVTFFSNSAALRAGAPSPSRWEEALSTRRNVLVLVVDKVQADVFERLLKNGAIDKTAFDGFTLFRNTVSGFSSTQAAIPHLLSGRFYRNDRPFGEYVAEIAQSPAFLPNIAAAAGLEPHLLTTQRVLPGVKVERLNPYEPARSFLKALEFSAFRQLPSILKQWLYNNGKWRLTNAIGVRDTFGLNDNLHFHDQLARWTAKDVPGQLKVFHLVGSHEPFFHDENLVAHELPVSRESYERITAGVGKIVTDMLSRLKQLELYDQTAIFVVADHGFGWQVLPPDDFPSASASSPMSCCGRALPLMLVKPFARRGPLELNDAPVHSGDLAPTVASLLGVDLGPQARSLFDYRADERRLRRHYELADVADDAANQRLSPMKEWEADGFSWLIGSWKESGKTFGDASELLSAFLSWQVGSAHLSGAKTSSSSGAPRIQLTNEHELHLMFPTNDVTNGATVALTAHIGGLDPQKRYRLRVGIDDTYENNFPGRIFHRVFVGSKLIGEYDIADESGAKLRELEGVLSSGLDESELRIEILSKTDEPWGWGGVSLRIRSISVEEQAQGD